MPTVSRKSLASGFALFSPFSRLTDPPSAFSVSLARASTTITTRFTANWGAADGFVASLACATYVNELQTNCPGNAAISTGTVIRACFSGISAMVLP